MYRPSPNEMARLHEEEKAKRKRIRLAQVRYQADKFAARTREAFKVAQEKELKLLALKIQGRTLCSDNGTLKRLQEEYERCLQSLGMAHKEAHEYIDPAIQMMENAEENEARAKERYEMALDVLRDDKLKKKKEQERGVVARQIAIEAERERAKIVAQLPPPQRQPYRLPEDEKFYLAKLKNQQKKIPVSVCDQQASSLVHFEVDHYSKVQREFLDEDESQPRSLPPDAWTVAENVQEKLDNLQAEVACQSVEFAVKAQVRGKEAIRKECVRHEYEQLVNTLEQFERDDQMRRQRVYHQLPKQVFAVPHKEDGEKKMMEKVREKAFESAVAEAYQKMAKKQVVAAQRESDKTLTSLTPVDVEPHKETITNSSDLNGLYSQLKQMKSKSNLENKIPVEISANEEESLDSESEIANSESTERSNSPIILSPPSPPPAPETLMPGERAPLIDLGQEVMKLRRGGHITPTSGPTTSISSTLANKQNLIKRNDEYQVADKTDYQRKKQQLEEEMRTIEQRLEGIRLKCQVEPTPLPAPPPSVKVKENPTPSKRANFLPDEPTYTTPPQTDRGPLLTSSSSLRTTNEIQARIEAFQRRAIERLLKARENNSPSPAADVPATTIEMSSCRSSPLHSIHRQPAEREDGSMDFTQNATLSEMMTMPVVGPIIDNGNTNRDSLKIKDFCTAMLEKVDNTLTFPPPAACATLSSIDVGDGDNNNDYNDNDNLTAEALLSIAKNRLNDHEAALVTHQHSMQQHHQQFNVLSQAPICLRDLIIRQRAQCDEIQSSSSSSSNSTLCEQQSDEYSDNPPEVDNPHWNEEVESFPMALSSSSFTNLCPIGIRNKDLSVIPEISYLSSVSTASRSRSLDTMSLPLQLQEKSKSSQQLDQLNSNSTLPNQSTPESLACLVYSAKTSSSPVTGRTLSGNAAVVIGGGTLDTLSTQAIFTNSSSDNDNGRTQMTTAQTMYSKYEQSHSSPLRFYEEMNLPRFSPKESTITTASSTTSTNSSSIAQRKQVLMKQYLLQKKLSMKIDEKMLMTQQEQQQQQQETSFGLTSNSFQTTAVSFSLHTSDSSSQQQQQTENDSVWMTPLTFSSSTTQDTTSSTFLSINSSRLAMLNPIVENNDESLSQQLTQYSLSMTSPVLNHPVKPFNSHENLNKLNLFPVRPRSSSSDHLTQISINSNKNQFDDLIHSQSSDLPTILTTIDGGPLITPSDSQCSLIVDKIPSLTLSLQSVDASVYDSVPQMDLTSSANEDTTTCIHNVQQNSDQFVDAALSSLLCQGEEDKQGILSQSEISFVNSCASHSSSLMSLVSNTKYSSSSSSSISSKPKRKEDESVNTSLQSFLRYEAECFTGAINVARHDDGNQDDDNEDDDQLTNMSIAEMTLRPDGDRPYQRDDYAVSSSAIVTDKDKRKKVTQENFQRTLRLWNRLDEVQVQKKKKTQEIEKQKNRERLKEYAEKLRAGQKKTSPRPLATTSSSTKPNQVVATKPNVSSAQKSKNKKK